MEASIKKLFEDYEKAFSALDIEKNAGFFAEPLSQPDPYRHPRAK